MGSCPVVGTMRWGHAHRLANWLDTIHPGTRRALAGHSSWPQGARVNAWVRHGGRSRSHWVRSRRSGRLDRSRPRSPQFLTRMARQRPRQLPPRYDHDSASLTCLWRTWYALAARTRLHPSGQVVCHAATCRTARVRVRAAGVRALRATHVRYSRDFLVSSGAEGRVTFV